MNAEATTAQLVFACMGTDVRLFAAGGVPGAAAHALQAAYVELHDFDRRLSRFRDDSELCRLNSDPRASVPVSHLMLKLVESSLAAATQTGGIVDPTLLGELEAAGYDHSLASECPASLRSALMIAPPRRPAQPRPDGAWRDVVVDRRHRVIRRPAGVRFDSGGTGKGLAADLAAAKLRRFDRFVVDCGGDIRVGPVSTGEQPYEIAVEHPLTREHSHMIRIREGAVATSGLPNRLWELPGGKYAHHIIDPSTGRPAWTGVISATAVAPTAQAAETLAKAALLSGPAGARSLLARHGGLFVRDDGAVELAGVLAANARPRYTVQKVAA